MNDKISSPYTTHHYNLGLLIILLRIKMLRLLSHLIQYNLGLYYLAIFDPVSLFRLGL